MDSNEVRKHIGKKCLIILRNNYKYTGVIPNFNDESFSIIDIFGDEISLTCDFISFLVEVNEKEDGE